MSKQLKKDLDNDYRIIPMNKIDEEAREISVRWGDEYFSGIALNEKVKLASDLMNYSRRKVQLFHNQIIDPQVTELITMVSENKSKLIHEDPALYEQIINRLEKLKHSQEYLDQVFIPK
jgi:hypothetical protein